MFASPHAFRDPQSFLRVMVFTTFTVSFRKVLVYGLIPFRQLLVRL
jgi:hypothetical protein